MEQLIAGLTLFFGSHAVGILLPEMRERVVARFGKPVWQLAYSAPSLAGLILIVNGYAEARLHPQFVYLPPYWLNKIAVVLMLPVFPLLFATFFPGRIKRATGHPVLYAVGLWSIAHLIANGTIADLLLFGGFLLWTLALAMSWRRRDPEPAPSAPPGRFNDLIAVSVGLAVYALLVGWAHFELFGVSPLVL